MKQLKKTLIFTVLALVMLFTCSEEVLAEKSNDDTDTEYGYAFDDNNITIGIGNKADAGKHYLRLNPLSTNAKIVKVKVTKKIAKVKISTSFPERAFTVDPIKSGQAYIKVFVKCDGVTRVHKIKLIIYQYKNPAKAFKLGNKGYKVKFKNTSTITVPIPKKSKMVKPNIKPKAGYEISYMVYYYYDGNGGHPTIYPENGKAFKLQNRGGSFQVVFTEKATGRQERLTINYQN